MIIELKFLWINALMKGFLTSLLVMMKIYSQQKIKNIKFQIIYKFILFFKF